MAYNITIRNERGEDIGGLITFMTNDSDRLGELVIPTGGTEIDSGAVGLADRFTISHPGYSSLTVSQLYEDGNVFTLYQNETWPLLLGGAVLFWLLTKLFK